MIKVDIINEVSQGRRHHQGEGRGGGRGRPRGDEGLHDEGGADRAARLRRLPGEAAQARHRPQPPHGQGSADPARPHDPLQARQGPPEPEPVAATPAWVTQPLPTGRPLPDLPDRRIRLSGSPWASGLRRRSAAGLGSGRRLRPARRSCSSCTGALRSALDAAGSRLVVRPPEHPARPRDGPLPRLPLLRRRRHAALLHPVPRSISLGRAPWAPSSASASPIPHRRALFDIGIAGPLAGFVVCLPVLWLGVLEATVAPGRGRRRAALFLGEPLLFQWVDAPRPRARSPTGMTLLIGPLGLAAWFGLLRHRPQPDARSASSTAATSPTRCSASSARRRLARRALGLRRPSSTSARAGSSGRSSSASSAGRHPPTLDDDAAGRPRPRAAWACSASRSSSSASSRARSSISWRTSSRLARRLLRASERRLHITLTGSTSTATPGQRAAP